MHNKRIWRLGYAMGLQTKQAADAENAIKNAESSRSNSWFFGKEQNSSDSGGGANLSLQAACFLHLILSVPHVFWH
jgi:hypothetical protein